MGIINTSLHSGLTVHFTTLISTTIASTTTSTRTSNFDWHWCGRHTRCCPCHAGLIQTLCLVTIAVIILHYCNYRKWNSTIFIWWFWSSSQFHPQREEEHPLSWLAWYYMIFSKETGSFVRFGHEITWIIASEAVNEVSQSFEVEQFMHNLIYIYIKNTVIIFQTVTASEYHDLKDSKHPLQTREVK